MECALCTETCTFFGLTECGHSSTCSLCWYRLRSLLHTFSCPVCRRECDFIFAVSSTSLSFESIMRTNWDGLIQGFTHDELSHMYFQDISELQRLQSFRKPICKVCRQESKNFKQLKDHLSLFHALKVCELCTQSNKLFASEQELYDDEAFKIHKITLHVQCDLCFAYYYDQRALLEHIKTQHFFCELCAVEKRTAYTNYENLEAHYRQAHYLCEVEMCRDEMHIVFMCYDDLKDHYRANHRGLQVPQPVCAFKVGEEEKPMMVFEDITAKSYSVPKIDEATKDFEFPALAPAAVETRGIDYSKIKNNNKPMTVSAYPQLSTKDQGSLFTRKIPEKLEEVKKKKKLKKPEGSLMEKNIARVNNGHMEVDEFVRWVKEDGVMCDAQFAAMIRDKVISNTYKEKIIQESMMKKTETRSRVEEVKLKIEEEKKAPIRVVGGDFPSLGPSLQPRIKSTSQTLIENIVILNNGLINCKYFVESMLSFVPRAEVNNMKLIIRDKVKPETRMNEVLRILDYNLLITAFDNEYPTLSNPEPKVEKSFAEVLSENIRHLNTGMMTTKEFLAICLKYLSDANVSEAIKTVKAGVYNSNLASGIIKEIQNKFSTVKLDSADFPTLKMISLPPEPKKPAQKKGKK